MFFKFQVTEAAVCRCFSKIGALKIFAVFTVFTVFTPVLDSYFNKFESLQACNFIKKRLQHRSFPMNFAELLRIVFFHRTPLASASESTLLLQLFFTGHMKHITL